MIAFLVIYSLITLIGWRVVCLVFGIDLSEKDRDNWLR